MPKVEPVVPTLRSVDELAAGPDRLGGRRSIGERPPTVVAPQVTDQEETAMVVRYVFVFMLMGMAPAIVLLYLQYLHPIVAPAIE